MRTQGGAVRVVLAISVPMLAAVLQGTLAPLVEVFGARPSFPLLVAASWSVAAGAGEAVWWAFVGGVATDLLSGGPLGAFATAALAPVAAIGTGERPVSRAVPVLLAAALVALATLAAGFLYIGILAITGQSLPPFGVVAFESVAGAAYTGALALIVYPLARIVRRVTEKQASFAW